MNNNLTLILFIIIIFISILLCLKNKSYDMFTSSEPTNTTTILGNLTVKKNVIFNGKNKNSLYFDLFPSGTILPFLHQNIPLNWALCDGSTWLYESSSNKWTKKTDSTNPRSISSIVNNNPSISNNMVITPNLSGRCLLGTGVVGVSTVGNNIQEYGSVAFLKDSSFTLNETGGEDFHKLTPNELGRHQHYVYRSVDGDSNSHGAYNRSNGKDVQPYYLSLLSGPSTPGKYEPNDIPHYNMAPYMALQYIVKL